jgi:hypothetical protein
VQSIGRASGAVSGDTDGRHGKGAVVAIAEPPGRRDGARDRREDGLTPGDVDVACAVTARGPDAGPYARSHVHAA